MGLGGDDGGVAGLDARKSYILNTTANYYGLDAGSESVSSLADAAELNSFLDDGNVTLLSANLDESGSKVLLDNATTVGLGKDTRALVFFKTRPSAVTPESLHRDVLVSSMLDSPQAALYHALHSVYSPLLLKDNKWSGEFDPKLQVVHLLQKFVCEQMISIPP